MQNETEATQVSRVGIKVPPFWAKNPSRWFSQIEAQFALANITQDETKFHHIVANLDPHIADEVGDIIDSPPVQGKYEKIKTELIARLSSSTEQQIRRLLEGEEIGDRRPSQFLRHLRGLAGAGISDAILRSLWMSRLPNNAQAILAMDDDVTLDKVAQKADKIVETMNQRQPRIAETSRQSSEYLHQVIEEIQKGIAKLVNAQEDRGRPRRRSRSRSQSRTRSRPRNPDLCWYHNKFAERAKKCTPPCNFVSGNENAGR